MKTVAIIGANGQLGTDLCEVFANHGWEVKPLLHSEIEVTDQNSVSNILRKIDFDWVINTSAFHKVDECERNPRRAWEVNSVGQKNVAVVANSLGKKAVFISSDYVFDGESSSPYSVTESVSPVNAYGHSKAGGELATLASNEKNLVMRISSVFGKAGSSGKGGNFIETILKKGRAGESLSVVDDITMAPTYTKDAAVILEVALSKGVSGVIHGANSGEATWFDFAKYSLEKAGISAEIAPSSTDWSAPLKRPRYSVLDSAMTTEDIVPVPTWQDAVDRYLAEKGHI